MTSSATKSGRILAIDYGRRRIGLAISDELHMTAQPLLTLLRKNRRDDLRRLREIAAENHITRIVVGHPMHLDGEESEMAAEAARFATRIHKALGIPTELYDERLTSWAADQMLAEDGAQGLSRGRHKTAATRRGQSTARSTRAAKDHFAAAILLRDFLDNKNARSSGKV